MDDMMTETIYYFEFMDYEKPKQFTSDRPKRELPRHGDNAMQRLVDSISKAVKVWMGKSH